MNILVFSWRDPKHPLAGGAEQVMHEHIKGWIYVGHRVTFFSSLFEGGKDEENIDGVRFLRKGSQYLTCHIYAFLWYLFSRKEKYDLVVDEFHGWPFFTPLYVRTSKLAVIQEVTKEVWFKYPLPLGLNYPLGVLGYILEPLFFLPYRKVKFMTGSESAKREVSQMGIAKSNITVIPHGVILDLPKKLPPKENVKTLIFLGAITKDKGIEDAIKCFSILNKSGKYQFWVVGKGNKDYLANLKKIVKKENLTSVKFFGFVSQNEKFELLAKAHLMINPSIREGWGLVNIEANAVGTPVIAYHSAGLVDSVSDGKSGLIVEANNPSELADKVAKVLSDVEFYKKLSRTSVLWSKQFSWDKSKKKSLKLISFLQ